MLKITRIAPFLFVILCLCTSCSSTTSKEEAPINTTLAVPETPEPTSDESETSFVSEESPSDTKTDIPLIPTKSDGTAYKPSYCEQAYSKAPEYSYSAEEWLVNGKLDYPFDIYEDTNHMQWNELHARYYVPEEALEQASTLDIVQAVKKYPMSSYISSWEARFVVNLYLSRINMASELFTRDDFAKVVLEDYKKSNYLLKNISKETGRIQDKGIILEELILATDQAFVQMSDDMKKQTLEAVMEKLEERSSGKYYCENMASYFFSSISEEYASGDGCLWHDYLSSEEFAGKYDDYIYEYFWYNYLWSEYE